MNGKVLLSLSTILLLLLATVTIAENSSGEPIEAGGILYELTNFEDGKQLSIYVNESASESEKGVMSKYERGMAPWSGNNILKISFTGAVKNISQYAFEGLNITTIELPYALTTIEKYAFSSCKQLTEINYSTRGSQLTTVENNAFEGCTKLSTFTVPASVISIGDNAFKGCTSLTAINVAPENNNYSNGEDSNFKVLFSKNLSTLYAFPAGKDGQYTVPAATTTIYKYAFSNCKKLTGITFTNNITSLGEYCFEECTGLKGTLTIPEKITTVPEGTFKNCNGVQSLKLSPGIKTLGNGAFYGCYGLNSLEFPDGINEIGNSTFEGCYGITGTISFPASITKIGNNAFYGCYGMNNGFLNFKSPETNGISIGTNAFGLGTEGHEVTCRVYSENESGWLDGYKNEWTHFVYGDDPDPPVPPVNPGFDPGNGWILFLILGLGFLIFILIAVANKKDEDEEENKKKPAKKKKANAAGAAR